MFRRRGAALLGLSALVTLACGDAPDETDETEEPSPRLFLSVASAELEHAEPTRLTLFDLSDPTAPRAKTILEAGVQGSTRMLRGASSPSGRYSLAQHVRDVSGSSPWQRELFLLDFEGDPFGPLHPLAIPVSYAAPTWSADESMVGISGWLDGMSLWTLELADGDPGAPARIPIEIPAYDLTIHELRWSPSGEWLGFTASDNGGEPRWRSFAVRFEDRWPVEVLELRSAAEASVASIAWIHDDGRALAVPEDGRHLLSYDLAAGDLARDLELTRIVDSCRDWVFVPGEGAEGEPAWLGHGELSDAGLFDFAWAPIDRGPDGFELGAPIAVDAPVSAYDELRVLAGDRLYFVDLDEDGGPERLMHVRAGEAQAEVFASLPPGFVINGVQLNREATRLLVHGAGGVLAFELGPDGPGPAILASPLGGNSWSFSLHHDRFVQLFWTSSTEGHVRLVELGERPPRRHDLSALVPLRAIPSPIDARVFVLDNFELYIHDPTEPTLRRRLGEPSLPMIHEFMVHAPGVGVYER